MAVQAKIPIKPVVLARNGYTRIWVLVGKPIHVDESLPRREQIQKLSQDTADWYTRTIRHMPDQWVVFHDQWNLASRLGDAIDGKPILDIVGQPAPPITGPS